MVWIVEDRWELVDAKDSSWQRSQILSSYFVNRSMNDREMILRVSILYNLSWTNISRDNYNTTARLLQIVDAYSVSVKSLFIFEIFEETLRSIVRSPISTTRPPLISGFTLQSVSLCEKLGHHSASPWV